jgi:hypothetical protein
VTILGNSAQDDREGKMPLRRRRSPLHLSNFFISNLTAERSAP